MRVTNPTTGAAIVATYEVLHGTAGIDPSTFSVAPDGELLFDYDGETEVDWDDQETVMHFSAGKFQRVFVDELGEHVTEDQLKIEE